MTASALIMIIVVYAFIYFCAAAFVALGELHWRKTRVPSDTPMVSVVLCARNEEKNLPRCLESLAAADYPPEMLEIIMVDDESSDRTHEICRRYEETDSRFHLLSTSGTPRTLIGKQRPLNLGIVSSQGKIVLGIDADMKVRPGWVRSHVAAFEHGVGIAGGTTRIDPSYGGLFASLQACDLSAKIAIARGCAGFGFPLTIMGNNISFRRDSYDKFGGFAGMKPRIVEDLALMNAITRDAGQKLGWASGVEGVADSTPEDRFDTFIEQRRRWLNEAGDMSVIGKLMIGFEFVMVLSFVSSLILSLWNPIPLIFTVCAWTGGNVLVLGANPGSTFRDMAMIPFMFLFQIMYGIVIGYKNLLGNGKIIWKGREYS